MNIAPGSWLCVVIQQVQFMTPQDPGSDLHSNTFGVNTTQEIISALSPLEQNNSESIISFGTTTEYYCSGHHQPHIIFKILITYLQVRTNTYIQLSYFRVCNDSIHKGAFYPSAASFMFSQESYSNKTKIGEATSLHFCFVPLYTLVS